MVDTFIEINDSDIRVAQRNTIILNSPGYAVLNKDKLHLGNEALGLSSLKPRMTCNRFWSNLNQEPLPIKSKHIRHHADLAYAHLLDIHEQIGKPDEIIFIVPGYYNKEHLALLLGLVEAGPFRAGGLFDAPVVAASSVAPETSGTCYYLEIYLHHFTVTRLQIDREIKKIDTEINDSVNGLLGVYSECVNYIADQFIAQTRFDPLRHAETERTLYEQLPSKLASLCERAEIPMRLEFAGTGYTVNIKSRPLLEKLNPLYEKITQTLDPELCCFVSHRIAVLPGFTDALNHYIVVDEQAVFKNCQRYLPAIGRKDGSFHLVDRLPFMDDSCSSPSLANSPVPGTPERETDKLETTPAPVQVSHVLCNGYAWKIGGDPLYLSVSGTIGYREITEPHCTVNTFGAQVTVTVRTELTVFRNGAGIDTVAAIVKPGDILTFAGSKTEYLFIAVNPDIS